MYHDRESDVADILRHIVPDAHPTLADTAIKGIETAMVLMIEPIGVQWMHDEAMWVMAELILAAIFFRMIEFHRHAAVQGIPRGAGIEALENASARHAKQKMILVAMIDDHGV